MNFLNYRVAYKQKLQNGEFGRALHYKQVSFWGELILRIQGKKIVKRVK